MRIEKKLIVTRKDGIHAKSASEIVNGLKDYNCSVEFIFKDKKVNAKSTLQLIGLAAKKGAEIHVILDGEDADDALVFIQWFLK
ncbi:MULTISPECIES: HPr family phosphocarrier protein [Bacillus cereus group]|uniref:HPr family phosphocarrier n=3 Tax=Bacillus cereus group TaxID=86661 RepID=R8NGT8_BACCX|nr:MULTISPECIES: HPr family phosphocarrier protein [Bacillus cereus group]EJP84941.1 HPr family phosphocarrier [Bacillus cereus VD142]EJV73738.1 HPr family phosphocarrier [Bacillus cereus HuA2-1]EOP45721.1 HPr family phosphocarrier [Bacillus cereus VD146]QWH31747.1 HPr family phosphocarrier protein [Bacillus mycoides]TKI83407.1 HPr family phosphocarrier protein [Bacillus mycoides]